MGGTHSSSRTTPPAPPPATTTSACAGIVYRRYDVLPAIRQTPLAFLPDHVLRQRVLPCLDLDGGGDPDNNNRVVDGRGYSVPRRETLRRVCKRAARLLLPPGAKNGGPNVYYVEVPATAAPTAAPAAAPAAAADVRRQHSHLAAALKAYERFALQHQQEVPAGRGPADTTATDCTFEIRLQRGVHETSAGEALRVSALRSHHDVRLSIQGAGPGETRVAAMSALRCVGGGVDVALADLSWRAPMRGLVADKGARVAASRCRFHDCGDEGLHAQRSSHIALTDCVLTGNRIGAAAYSGGRVHLRGDGTRVHGSAEFGLYSTTRAMEAARQGTTSTRSMVVVCVGANKRSAAFRIFQEATCLQPNKGGNAHGCVVWREPGAVGEHATLDLMCHTVVGRGREESPATPGVPATPGRRRGGRMAPLGPIPGRV